MERRFFLKLLAASIAATNVYRIPQLHAETSGGHNLALPLKLNLTGAGRIGFYIDYSELDAVGTHTFYVTRTHGSQGTVGCTWTAYDSADGSQLESGLLDWDDGALDILSFTVDIASKPDGDHRVYVLLSNPTGGVALHHGNHTVAYGIIDDDTIATSNAIFIDAGAATNGTGSEASPYNNWYSARDALLVTDRYIYIKGKMIPDDTDAKAASTQVKNLSLQGSFGGRTSESQRLVIRNWPTFVGGVDGGGQTDVAGFNIYGPNAGTSIKFITFRGLEGTNLDNTSGGSSGGGSFFLRTQGFDANKIENLTAENININGIISGANAAVAVWWSQACTGLKMWRWNLKNTSHAFIDSNLTTFQCYETDNVSIQRCSISSTSGGIYQKSGSVGTNTVGLSCRFNYFDKAKIRISTGSGRLIQNHHIIQNNIFDTPLDGFTSSPLAFDTGNQNAVSQGQHISNNVFYDYNFSTSGDVGVSDEGFEKLVLYNNIFYKSKRPFRLEQNAGEAEYIDYNHYEFTDVTAPVFRIAGGNDVSLQELKDSTPFATNTTTGDPALDTASWRLASTSSCNQSGVYGTSKGVYLLGTEKIGADNLSNSAPPAKMSPPNITIIDG
jgi:hypothetical protein